MASQPSPVRIDVTAPSGSYPVLVGEGLASRLAPVFEGLLPVRRFVVSNPLVWRLHGQAVARGLAHAEPILIPDGERFKTLATVSRLYESLLLAQADRRDGIVTVGGGVVSDTAGFAAATYQRGLVVAHVPTTLVAQVDAAIGGKVGVNHPLGPDIIGAFHQPSVVAVDPVLLETLPRREFRAGIYEAIKAGMACDASLLERIDHDLRAIVGRVMTALLPLIVHACRVKAAVIAADERETGGARALTFGHTTAHAIEALTKYRRFRHGEAVAYGMLVASELAVARGTLTDGERKPLSSLIARLGPLPPVGDLVADEVVDAIRGERKAREGTLGVVLPAGPGRAAVADDVEDDELEGALVRVGFRCRPTGRPASGRGR